MKLEELGHQNKEIAIALATKELSRVMREYAIAGTWLSEESGVGRAQISNFINGKLNRLSTENFIAIVRALPIDARWDFVESVFLKTMEQPNRFYTFLKEWQAREEVSDYHFILSVQQRTPMSIEAIRSILAGRDPNDTELGFIGTVLRKPNGNPYSYEELLGIRNGKDSPH